MAEGAVLLRPPELCSCVLNPAVVLLCLARKMRGLDQRLKTHRRAYKDIPWFALQRNYWPLTSVPPHSIFVVVSICFDVWVLFYLLLYLLWQPGDNKCQWSDLCKV